MNTLFRVRVGYFDYTVIEDNEKVKEYAGMFAGEEAGTELLGICAAKDLCIYIAEYLHPQRQREVIWHELGHAIQDLSGLQSCSAMTGEDAVGSLTLLQLMVLRDNPQLRQFLLED